MEYQRKENCFSWISHVKGAQRLMEKQLETLWPEELNKIVKENHPLSKEICRPLGLSYYWGAQESEYATDLMFQDAQSLARIYPGLVHHAISTFSSPDVMRFLGHNVPVTNKSAPLPRRSDQRAESSARRHSAKHMSRNRSKFTTNRQRLRVETTLNRAKAFRVYRASEKDPKGKSWRIRSGLPICLEEPRCHKANER
jgi:hypothetical protein